MIVNFATFCHYTMFYRKRKELKNGVKVDLDLTEAATGGNLQKKGVLRNFAKFTGKHPCQSLLFRLRPTTLLKKRLWHRCFPVNFAKFLRTPFLQNTSGRLLLNLTKARLDLLTKVSKYVNSLSNVDFVYADTSC